MEFVKWREAVLKSVKEKGFRATSREFNIALSSLRTITLGDEYAGLRTWKKAEEENKK